MLRKIYSFIIVQAEKSYAPWVLGSVAFLESSVSPFPPDPLMIPMILADRRRAFWLALLTTLASVVGGALGYAIGYYLFEYVGEMIIHTYGLESSFEKMKTWFQAYGFWIILAKGLTPIPFKVVTITSGVTGLNFMMFMSASLISRGLRFYLEAFLLWRYGEIMRTQLERNLIWIAVAGTLALVGGFVALKWVF